MKYLHWTFWLGLAIALFGAFVMFQGSLFGENNSGIATIIGIVGIGLIGMSGALTSAKAGTKISKIKKSK